MRTLKPAIAALTSTNSRHIGRTRRTIVGSTLTKLRLSLWTKSPLCACCGRFIDYPAGFELDHIVPLANGGTDRVDNMQLLCVWYDVDGSKRGCHIDKTAAEAANGWGGGREKC